MTSRRSIFGGVCEATPPEKKSFGFSAPKRMVRARPTLGSTELPGAGRLVEAPRAVCHSCENTHRQTSMFSYVHTCVLNDNCWLAAPLGARGMVERALPWKVWRKSGGTEWRAERLKQMKPFHGIQTDAQPAQFDRNGRTKLALTASQFFCKNHEKSC